MCLPIDGCSLCYDAKGTADNIFEALAVAQRAEFWIKVFRSFSCHGETLFCLRMSVSNNHNKNSRVISKLLLSCPIFFFRYLASFSADERIPRAAESLCEESAKATTPVRVFVTMIDAEVVL